MNSVVTPGVGHRVSRHGHAAVHRHQHVGHAVLGERLQRGRGHRSRKEHVHVRGVSHEHKRGEGLARGKVRDLDLVHVLRGRAHRVSDDDQGNNEGEDAQSAFHVVILLRECGFPHTKSRGGPTTQPHGRSPRRPQPLRNRNTIMHCRTGTNPSARVRVVRADPALPTLGPITHALRRHDGDRRAARAAALRPPARCPQRRVHRHVALRADLRTGPHRRALSRISLVVATELPSPTVESDRRHPTYPHRPSDSGADDGPRCRVHVAISPLRFRP